ncbi:MAG: Hin recombinase, partial [Proteobacteria bacterium]
MNAAEAKKRGSRQKLTPEQQEEVIRRNEKGESVAELARAFGVSHWTVDAIFKRLKISPKKQDGASWALSPGQKQEAISRYVKGEDGLSLAAEYGVTFTSIYAILERAGVSRRVGHFQEKYSDSERIAVAESYKRTRSSVVTAKEFGMDISMVCLILEKFGIERREPADCARKHDCDHEFFSRLTPESAYWTGFLAADGDITKNFEVRLRLHRKDEQHVLNFIRALSATHEVRRTDSNKKNQRCDASGVAICSRKMVEDLAVRHVIPRKSLIAKPWEVPGYLERFYWLGLVDGDGWVSKFDGSLRSTGIGLCGSYEMVSGFASWVKRFVNVNSTVRPMRSIYSFRVSGRNSEVIARILWSDAPMALERKAIRA